jgi:replicative DNA helicase
MNASHDPSPSRSGRDAARSGSGAREPERRDWKQLSRLLEQLPPHAIEAEMSLLGSMLIDPQVVGDAVLIVRSGEDFFKPANGAIYDAMVELYDRHGALDIVLLNQLLVDRDVLRAVGGLDYLVELANAVPTAANATHFARLVRDKASIRRLIEAAGDVLQAAYNSPEDPQIILEEAEQRIFRIAERSEHAEISTLQSLVDQAMKMIEANDGKHITGVPTGFIDLDEISQGMQRGEMIILAARPSMGKTAFVLNVAEQMAMQKYAVGVFSLEMSKLQLVQRLLSARSGVNSQKIRRSMLNADDHQRLHVACDDLLDAKILIDDTPGLTLLQLRAKARRMAAKHDVQAILIDYLQLMSTGGRVESRQMEITEQLNRAAEQREGHRPRMSDLRESGSIEQDADVVMMLHREEYYHQADPEWGDANPEKVGLAELIITKQRNGPTGTVKLTWASEITRFHNFSSSTLPVGYYEQKPTGPAAAPPAGSHFSPGRQTGPVEGHRDGGGPEAVGDIPI